MSWCTRSSLLTLVFVVGVGAHSVARAQESADAGSPSGLVPFEAGLDAGAPSLTGDAALALPPARAVSVEAVPVPAELAPSDVGPAPSVILESSAPPLDPILADAEAYGARATVERPAGPGEFGPAGTGSRVNAPLEELPFTVSTIRSEVLRERGVTDISSALSLTPGITAPNTYGGFIELWARGFQVIPLNDGRRDARSVRASSAPQAGLFDLDRIEFLRGPSAALYGLGAVGGVVNLIRKRASETPLYELELGLGTPSQYRAHAGAQGPITDTLSYRVDLGHLNHENFRGFKSRRSQVASTLRYQPTRRNTINVRFAYSFDKYNTDVGIPTIEDPTRPGKWTLPPGARYRNRYNSQQDYFDYQRMEAAADYRYELSKSTYVEVRGAVTQDNYQYLAAETLEYVPAMGTLRARVDREYLYFKRNWRPIQGSAELHKDFHTGPVLHQLVLGYSIESFTGTSNYGDPTDAVTGEDAAPLAPLDWSIPVDNSPKVGFVRNRQDHFRTATHSVYGFDHMKLTDDLVLTGGARFDRLLNRSRREFIARESEASIPDPMTGAYRKPNLNKDAAVSGQVGLVYNFWRPLIAYVSYATGFKPQFTSPSASSVSKYNAERSQQFEGGLRVRVEQAHHVFTVDVAGYLIRKRNLLIPRGVDDTIAAGLAQSRGVDLFVHYQAPKYLQLDASYSRIDSEYKKFVGDDAVTGEPTDFKGNELMMAPRHSGTLWARGLLTDKFKLGIGSRIMGKQFADDQNRLELPNYALLDLSASYGDEHATFTVSANNVLNRTDYLNSVINNGSAQPQVTPGAGREILGTLRLAL